MGPALFIMAILGCGEAEAPCRQVATADAVYSNRAECTAATPAAIEQHMDIAYPVVVAECRAADRATAQQVMPSDIKLPEGQRPAPVRRASAKSDKTLGA
ncbi:MAG: hypothetical protein JWN69_58 [Alphaproteobacteria bacterium]|nr:hypothetical protein [Alphaproteobacteria bacterium]